MPFACYCFNSMPTSDDLVSLFFLIHGRDPLDGCAELFCSDDTRYMGDEKGLILFAELRKFWSTHAKSLQENRLSKTDTLECNKNFKSYNFKVGQLMTVKNHLKGTFNPKFISDYRILDIINKHTLLIQSPNGKTRKKIMLMTQNQFQLFPQLTTIFKQSMLRKGSTHHYHLHSSST